MQHSYYPRYAGYLGRGGGGGTIENKLANNTTRLKEQRWFPSGPFDWTSWTRNQSNRYIFVHIGKAGGSTLYCALGNNKDRRLCPGTSAPTPPLYVVNFDTRCHMMGCRTTDFSRYAVALVSLRNPIERILSAYNYESVRRNKWVQIKLPDFRGKCFWGDEGQKLFQALSEEPPTYDRDDDEYYCWELARNVTTGKVLSYPSHMTFNFAYYESFLPIHPEPQHHILAIRQSHMESDLARLDGFLQTGIVEEDNVEALLKGHNSSNSTSVTGLKKHNQGKRVNTTAISKEGYANACRILCPEIQSYKRFLLRAENLNDRMVQESLQELQATCSEEPTEIRECF